VAVAALPPGEGRCGSMNQNGHIYWLTAVGALALFLAFWGAISLFCCRHTRVRIRAKHANRLHDSALRFCRRAARSLALVAVGTAAILLLALDCLPRPRRKRRPDSARQGVSKADLAAFDAALDALLAEVKAAAEPTERQEEP
jgi:hypothetical protein